MKKNPTTHHYFDLLGASQDVSGFPHLHRNECTYLLYVLTLECPEQGLNQHHPRL